MPKYNVYLITKISKHIGTFSAKTEAEAIDMAERSDEYQNIGGLCHQCTDALGDEDDQEFVSFKET